MRKDPTTARTLILVPTYNESSNIDEVVRKIFASLPHAHVLVVDDHSPDGTADIVEKLREKFPQLDLIRRDGERGLGRAYTAAIHYALDHDFEIIGTMDADLSHDPGYLPAMLLLLRDHDVVIGSRYVRDGGTVNWAIRRILLSWLANKFAAAILRVPAHDVTSGYRLYRRHTLEWIRTMKVRSTGYSFVGELLYRAYRNGARIVEFPIVFIDRTMGVSKLHRREIYLGIVHLLRLRLSRR
ncbi:MAG TPA: polyprenol monophosphomannose synthase [Chthoniobacterales bacterium]|jgi:dolichol-phosphate mannosyltransferase|nr:polyprenol monophosphomannose synthase [Chthoniobacterales bacterium]